MEKKLSNTVHETFDAKDYLNQIKNVFGFDEKIDSAYILQQNDRRNLKLRISNHNMNTWNANKNENTTSIVIKLVNTRFKIGKKVEASEFVYNGDDLKKEKLLGIISGLKDWTEKGEYTDTHFDKKYITTKEEIINKNIKKLKVQSGTVYGFAYEEKIYLNPDTINSNAAVHEYTHLWDNYTRQTNPKLWNKGKKILSKTHLWNEVKNDPNYKDIAQDDDLVLSEVHARICGDMAQKVLERMAQEDGKLTKDSAIRWDKETWK